MENFEKQLDRSKATKQLIDYLSGESNGEYTEFRLVVQENGTAYIHVLGRDSATLNFSLQRPINLI